MMAHFYQGVGVVTLSTRICVHIDLTLIAIEGPLKKRLRKGVVIDSGHSAQHPNQGIYDEKDPLVAHNVIHHGAQYPSVVILPVVNAGNASATAADQNR